LNLKPIVILALVSVGWTWSVPQPQKAKERFDPDGAFWFHGTPPKEFQNVGGINLNSKRTRRLPAAGVELTNGKRFAFKSLTVKRESLVFTTVTVGGVSYSFSGRFLKGGVYAAGDLDPDAPVLEGTLIKWNGSRKVAEASLKFTYFGGT
jgi:hypothetical protein